MSNIDVKLFKADGSSNQLAYGHLKVADLVTINIRLIKTKSGGMMVGFPSYQGKDGEWKNYADTVSKEARTVVTNAVVAAYNRLIGSSNPTGNQEDQRVEAPAAIQPAPSVPSGALF